MNERKGTVHHTKAATDASLERRVNTISILGTVVEGIGPVCYVKRRHISRRVYHIMPWVRYKVKDSSYAYRANQIRIGLLRLYQSPRPGGFPEPPPNR